MRVRVICSLRLLGCFLRVETSADHEFIASGAEALGPDSVTRGMITRRQCPNSFGTSGSGECDSSACSSWALLRHRRRQPQLLPVTATTIASGSYLNVATATNPSRFSARPLHNGSGSTGSGPGERIWVANQWFYVAGILNPSVLGPPVDISVLVGYPAAQRYLDYSTAIEGETSSGPPSTIYVRAKPAK
jgi:hypothetical protein